MPDPLELAGIPIEVRPDRTLRVKIIDACGLACTFCHNEGTPVTADNRDRLPQDYMGGPGTRTGRVSIYVATNRAGFLSTRIEPGPDFALALAAMRGSLAIEEVHFTGGEPTLHPELPELVALARSMGLTVGLTSNGENGAAVIPAAAEAGLDRINLSVFGTTPSELAAVQGSRLAGVGLAARKLAALDRTIDAAIAHGVKVSANMVVPDGSHVPRVLRVLDAYGQHVVVRLLLNLETADASSEAMREVLTTVGATPDRHFVTAGTSDQRTRYRLPDGRTMYVKTIRPVRLPDTCAGCHLNNPRDCQEGYYGVRLYKSAEGPFMVGVCIRRMDLTVTLGEFVMSRLSREVQELRDDEMARLTALARESRSAGVPISDPKSSAGSLL
ncbi:radical SAM protein [Streptomyces sp. NPDC127098]|uniref:radical SAM protein n=1 Tax=Streptomyces sp. NPDC127098 TaxID=3347137 RepID=UPI00365A2F55